MNDAPAILTRGLTKSYGPVQALRGVDIEVRRGEIFGFLGPNGAGKTTTIRCLLPSRRLAAMTAGMVLVARFFLVTLARLDSSLDAVARLSPMRYHQSGDAIAGLNGLWLAGLLAAASLFMALAWYCFERRDIRVVDEGSWRWPRWGGARLRGSVAITNQVE